MGGGGGGELRTAKVVVDWEVMRDKEGGERKRKDIEIRLRRRLQVEHIWIEFAACLKHWREEIK